MHARDDLTGLKAKVKLSAFVGLRVKLSKRGADWWGPCPFHQEKTGSFSVNDAKGFYHCFGCHAHGDALDWWQHADGLSLPEAIDRLKVEAGEAVHAAQAPRQDAVSNNSDDAEAMRKRDQALEIWRSAKPFHSTLAETYLCKARGIKVELPPSLRFHAGLPVYGGSGDFWPALVAVVQSVDGEVIAIQRTFLERDGLAKAPIDSPKRSLAPLKGGAVRLGEAAKTLGIAEGIETGLSAMQLFALPVWCALGNNFGRLALPSTVSNVVIFADRGEAGEVAANKAALAFRGTGRKVSIRFPRIGKDFNDELKGKANG